MDWMHQNQTTKWVKPYEDFPHSACDLKSLNMPGSAMNSDIDHLSGTSGLSQRRSNAERSYRQHLKEKKELEQEFKAKYF